MMDSRFNGDGPTAKWRNSNQVLRNSIVEYSEHVKSFSKSNHSSAFDYSSQITLTLHTNFIYFSIKK